MKIFIKIILVLNLLVAFHRNLLFIPQYYAFAGKKASFFETYRKKTDNKVSPYVNYYSALTGLETGYGFYAPNIPDVVKIEFTIQSASGNQVCAIKLNTSEGRERFNALCNHFNGDADAREIVAHSLATYMFHFFPGGQRIIVTAYNQSTPLPADYLRGVHVLTPTVIASYSFNKSNVY